MSAPVRASDRTAGAPAPILLGAHSLARQTARPLLHAWLRLRVEDASRVPTRGGVLVASTHQSHADSIALGVAVQRPLHFLGDVRLVGWPLLGPMLPRLGMVPVRRGEGDAAALGHLADLLQSGAAIAVYPEGSRSRDGRVHRLRSGVARLAAQTGVPVVPAAVAGIYDVWPIGRRPRLRGGRVTVRFGPPLPPPADAPRDRRAFNEHLHEQLAALAGVEQATDFSPAGGGGP